MVTRFLAWRFLLKSTEKGGFSPMTFFAWLAIGVGIGAMSSLLSVMYGFEATLRDRVLNAYPHLMVKPAEAGAFVTDWTATESKLRSTPGAVRVMPYAENEMIVQSDHRTVGSVIWGIRISDFQPLAKNLKEGKIPSLESDLPQVWIGSELANRIGVEVGSRVRLISPLGKSGPLAQVPQSALFEVVGLYASGHYEFDEQYVFLVLEDFQDLMRWANGISGFHVWASDLDSADTLKAEIAKELPPPWKVISWSEFNSALFSSLKLEQYSMFTILSFAILIAVMNIVITLAMHVTHKRKNIGVLRALGASRRQVRQVFLWQGLLMGGVGLASGALLTVLFVVYVRYFSHYQLPEIYYDRSIPIELRPLSLFLIYSVATLLIFLATLYPAARAAKQDPVAAIRE